MNILNKLNTMPLFYIIISLIVNLCVASIITSVMINFILMKLKSNKIKINKICPVEALTILAFFVGVFLIIKFKLGFVKINNETLNRIVIITGVVFIVAGSIMNIIARINLGTNWSNNIRVYENQKIITSGMFKIVRHPLFFSLILMFTGSSIIYKNYFVLILTLCIFIPSVYYRALMEEKMLKSEFPEYIEYCKKVPMLFPIKFKKEVSKVL